MKLIDVLNELERALTITEEKLFHRLIVRMIDESQNPRYIKTLEKVKLELEKPHADLSPNEIWLSEGWTIGKLFPFDVFDYHATYYLEIRKFIEENVLDNRIKNLLIPIFTLPLSYKNSQKSEFHKPSMTYKEFLEDRKNKFKIIYEIMESI